MSGAAAHGWTAEIKGSRGVLPVAVGRVGRRAANEGDTPKIEASLNGDRLALCGACNGRCAKAAGHHKAARPISVGP